MKIVSSSSVEPSAQIPVKLIYVHGTNQNTTESRAGFEGRVARLHAHILEEFNRSHTIRNQLFNQDQYVISPESVAFFWGDRSHSEIEFLKKDLNLLQGFQTRLAGSVREKLAYVLHDAVWFERPKNKYRILTELHETVMSTHQGNLPILLMGHSAGSLVVFNYLTFLLPLLDTQALLHITKPPEEVAEVIVSANLPPTSALALINSGAFHPDLTGRLVSTYQKESGVGIASLSADSKKLYLENLPSAIRQATETSCLPPHVLLGMVTFGSPIPIFESDLGRHEDVFSLLVSYMLKYLLENGMVWMHANHVNDPVGFPIPGIDIVKRIEDSQGIHIEPKGGMIIDNSNIRGGAHITKAHFWYWEKPEDFARILVKTYEENFVNWQKAMKKVV